MRAPSEAELLALWERGSARHPIDRALLLGGFARPELPPSCLPDIPLGALNAALLGLRAASFGSRIAAYVDCEQCGERLDLGLDTGQLLADASETDARPELEMAGLRFRAPCARDLAEVVHERDPHAAALKLAERCRVDGTDCSLDEISGRLAELEAGLETLDPLADIGLAVVCDGCGNRWVADLDIGALLWEEIETRARAVLTQIHRLARAYGWTEPEILALSPHRRAAYLNLVES